MERGSRAKFFFFGDGLSVGRFSFLLSLFYVEWLLCGGGWRVLCVSVCVCGCLLKSVNNVN